MKKKFVVIFVLLFAINLMVAGCNSTPVATEEVPAETKAPPEPEPPVEEAKLSHILVFETCAATLTQEADGYSIAAFVENYFDAQPAGDVVVCATDGYCANSTAEEMMNYYIVMEGDDAPTLAGADLSKGLKVKDIFTISFGNEVILFVESDYPFSNVITALNLDPNLLYTFVATDAFEWPAADATDAQNAKMLSAATTGNLVNVYFDSMGADLRECYEINVTKAAE